MRLVNGVFLGTTLLLAGCADDVASGGGTSTSGDGTETGAGTATVGTGTTDASGSSTGTVDGTTGGSSSSEGSETSGSSESSSGGPAFGQGRFLAASTVEAAGGSTTRGALISYVGGAVSETVLFEDAFASGLSTTPAGEVALYRYPAGDGPLAAYAADLTSNPIGDPQAFAVAPVPDGANTEMPRYLEGSGLFTFEAYDFSGWRGLYVTSLEGGTLTPPQVVFEGLGLQSHIDYDVAGTRVTYRVESAEGTTSVYVDSLEVPDASNALVVTTSDGQIAPILSYAGFVPGQDALIYAVDEDVFANEVALFYVDIAGGAPSAPVRVDDPGLVAPDARVSWPRHAPDGHALVYWAGTDLLGSFFMVDMSGGAPAQAAPIDSFMGGNRRDLIWSDDSRWLAYVATVDAEETEGLFLLDATSGVPGEPWSLIEDLVPGGGVAQVRYDPDSQWLYLIANVTAQQLGLFRVDVSGDAPGELQRVSSRDERLTEEWRASRDWSQLLYTAFDANGDIRLYRVDVSGEEPGMSIRVDDLPRGSGVALGAEFSFDGTVMVYRERVNPAGSPEPGTLVDLVSGERLPFLDDLGGLIPVVDAD